MLRFEVHKHNVLVYFYLQCQIIKRFKGLTIKSPTFSFTWSGKSSKNRLYLLFSSYVSLNRLQTCYLSELISIGPRDCAGWDGRCVIASGWPVPRLGNVTKLRISALSYFLATAPAQDTGREKIWCTFTQATKIYHCYLQIQTVPVSVWFYSNFYKL